MNYVIYNKNTGVVLSFNQSSRVDESMLQKHEAYLEYSGPYDVHINLDTLTVEPGAIDDRTDNEQVRDAWLTIRRQRDQLLTDTDWRITKQIEQNGSVTPEWQAYRQALRDITNQADPFNIIWPIHP